ncbi:MAG: hypothetical protein GWO24_01870, partial [Akkermansiaceae bacterium]|nr:hypothetical protein [Akkermansiaceae bacterium]
MLALAMLAGEVAVHASGFRPKGVTMLVVPARYSVLQVAFDILSKRDAVLVAYQGDPTSAEPLLHAWDGREWVYVTMEKYRDLGFLDLTPSQVVLVGDESLLPPSLIDASGWSPQVMNVPFIDTAALVNSFGQLFSFRRS